MRWVLLRLLPVLRLTRVTTAFGAVANVWFVIVWTRRNGVPDEPGAVDLTGPLWALLLAGAVNALGLFAYAAALNDLLDVRRDRALHPGRPLASGRVSAEGAVAIIVGTLLVAMLSAAVLGLHAVVLTIVVAAAVLFFHAAGKFVPAIGLVSLGLIYAGQMVVPNVRLHFVWPVWLVMTHCLAVAGLTHALARRVPQISARAAAAAFAGWALWSVVILGVGWWRDPEGRLWPAFVSPAAAAPVVVAALLFAFTVLRKVRLLGGGPRAGEKVARYGALWLAIYAAAWTLGQNHMLESAILALLALAGFAGMTILREVYAFVEQPLGYRR